MTKSKIVTSVCFAALLAFTGCTTSFKVIDLDKDTKGYDIFCGGQPYSSPTDCADRAADICGDKGYTVLHEKDASYAHTQSIWDLSTHETLVRCNSAAPVATPAPDAPAQ